jgi:Mor family transcriptional regulator
MYQIYFLYCVHGPKGVQVSDTILLTTEFPEEANAALTELNSRGVLALQKVAEDAGKAFYQTNLPMRNAAIVRRHLMEGESVSALAKRFHLHQTTIRGVIDEYKRTMANANRFHYQGL